MKKFLPLTFAALLFTACNPPTTTDPTTLTFTGTGTAQNIQAIDTPYSLTNTFNKVSLVVGTLNTDKSVSVSLDPTKITSWVKLSDWKANMADSGCDVSKLNITTDTAYYIVQNLAFSEGTTNFSLDAGTTTKNSDGTTTYVHHKFFYVKSAGQMTGQATCPDTAGARTFDVQLKPGWNIIDWRDIYNPTTKLFTSYAFTTGAHTNTYNGPWTIYSLN